ncbi:MAG TPA: flagellar motor switch protein FliG [Bryobacteraceae bacterium]|nr:flagellar motor switch protein FliG [Bryobacteraceae bacterium]
MIINDDAAPQISGIRKAAILIVVLGDQIGPEVLRLLDENEVESVSKEVAKMTAISSEQAEKVLEECYNVALAHDYVLKGGVDYARKILMNAFGPDHAKRMLDRMMKSLGSEVANFDALQKADPSQLAKFIHNEHPQTIALVLSHLNSSQAAGLLFSLPSELRADVALRMANLDQISPEIISKIAGIIGQRMKALGEVSRESYGGVRAVAEMFNRLDSSTSRDILDTIEAEDPTLVQSIRHLMFVFEDLLLLSQEGVKEVLAKLDRKLLTTALKGTSDRLREHFMASMSQRGAEMLREDMDALGPTKIKEVDAAQQQIIALVRRLESEGTISLKGAVGEQYVV